MIISSQNYQCKPVKCLEYENFLKGVEIMREGLLLEKKNKKNMDPDFGDIG